MERGGEARGWKWKKGRRRNHADEEQLMDFPVRKKGWGTASLASGRKVMLDWRGEARASQVGLGFGTRAGINFHSEKSTAETAEIFCSIWFFHVP